jgi:hypothetical protein
MHVIKGFIACHPYCTYLPGGMDWFLRDKALLPSVHPLKTVRKIRARLIPLLQEKSIAAVPTHWTK